MLEYNQNSPELDLNQLSDLVGSVEASDAALLSEVLEVFERETEDILQQIEGGVERENRPQLARALHSLGGSSSNLGLARLSGLSLTVESRVDDLDSDALSELPAVFREETDRAVHALRVHYGLVK